MQKTDNKKAQTMITKERKRHRFTIAAMLLSYLPFLLFAELPAFTSDSLISYFARQTGYMAAVLLLWQFILGTRAVTKLWIQDQVWALNLHKKIGIYGILLVVAHPLLIWYDYSWSIQLGFNTEFNEHVTFGFIAFVMFLVVWLSSAILRANIGYRPWKYIHYLTYPLMMAVILHPPDIGTFFAAHQLIEASWMVLFIVFMAMVLIRLGSVFTVGQRPYELTELTEVAEDVFRYTLVPKKKQLHPAPGQFVYVRRGILSEEHPFSVAGYSEDGTIQIVAKRFGKYTTKLAQTAVGSKIYLDGPYGVFTNELSVDPKSPTTFIAGGIGITPFLQHLYSDNTDNIHLFNANRDLKNVLYRDQLRSILGTRYTDVLSDSKKSGHGIKHGYVGADMLKEVLGQDFDEQQFYICGPPIMMTAVKKQLLDAGIRLDRIHTEEFGY